MLLGPYLSYWLDNVIKPNWRPSTYGLYKMTVRVHLTPGLGKYPLKRLSVPIVQAFLNGKIQAGCSVGNVHIMRQVLSSALSRAIREELISRNVARLVELPEWEPAEMSRGLRPKRWPSSRAPAMIPSTPHSSCCCCTGCAGAKLSACAGRTLTSTARSSASASSSTAPGGELHIGPVKTSAGRRDLPLLGLARDA